MRLRFIGLLALVGLIAISVAVGQDGPPGEQPPPTVFSRIEECGAADDFDGAAYVVVVDSAVNQVSELGVSRMESYRLLKVLTGEGCRTQSVLSWHYEPLSSFVIVEDVAIVRGDSLIPVDVSLIKDLPAPQSAIYWQDRIKLLPLPRLEVGDGIQIKAFRKGYSYALLDQRAGEPPDERYVPPMPGEYFDIVRFGDRVPVLFKKYTLRLPAGKRLHSQVYNGTLYSATTYDSNHTTYSWWREDMTVRPHEESSPDASDAVTKVVLATVESWEAKSRWFFDVNRNQFEVTEPIKVKVDEILQKAGVANGTDEEKAFELVHWVAQNIRYSGQSMGEGEGFTLHPGSMIFEQRSGVCKDIAGMLVTMMRAADLDSYAAMTMAGSRIEAVPADQFNHCVVALRKPDGAFEMYDPTWVPNVENIWSKYEAEQDYLIGTPEGQPLGQIAYSPPSESPLEVTHEANLATSGRLSGKIRWAGRGTMDGRLRNLMVYSRRNDLENAFASRLRSLGSDVLITEIRHGDHLDFHEPMWWEVEYVIPSYAFVRDERMEFPSPMMHLFTHSGTLTWQLAEEWSEQRTEDLMLWSAWRLDVKESLRLPSGYACGDMEATDPVDETYASFDAEASARGPKFDLSASFELRRRQFPVDGYEGFRKAVNAARSFGATVYQASKGGPSND